MNTIAITILLLFPMQKNSGSTVFQPIRRELATQTSLTIRLPKFIGAEHEKEHLYASVESATANKYVIRISYAPDCEGGNACRYGFVSGEKLKSNRPQLEGEPVILAKGIRGYFTDATCGASCSDSIISWVQAGVLYQVGIKAEKKEILKKVANSAINVGHKNSRH